VSFDKLATDGLELQYPYGFEFGCATANGTMSQWMEGSAMKADGDSVMVELPDCLVDQRPLQFVTAGALILVPS